MKSLLLILISLGLTGCATTHRVIVDTKKDRTPAENIEANKTCYRHSLSGSSSTQGQLWIECLATYGYQVVDVPNEIIVLGFQFQ